MCTMCNSGYTNSCNSALTQANVLSGNSSFGCGQRICRDCNGNVWVRRTTNCGCCQQQSSCCQQNTDTSNCGCGCGCGCGLFTVFGRIVSGNVATTTSGTATANSDSYYARQYGYSRCGCCGSGTNDD